MGEEQVLCSFHFEVLLQHNFLLNILLAAAGAPHFSRPLSKLPLLNINVQAWKKPSILQNTLGYAK